MKKIRMFFNKWYIKFFIAKHKYPASTLIHRRLATIVYEIEFNWYDNNFEPVSIVREIKTNKIFSMNHLEMQDCVEYTGNNEHLGSNIPMQVK